jgi:membrane protein implicated in regulation of membrane protease activity
MAILGFVPRHRFAFTTRMWASDLVFLVVIGAGQVMGDVFLEGESSSSSVLWAALAMATVWLVARFLRRNEDPNHAPSSS